MLNSFDLTFSRDNNKLIIRQLLLVFAMVSTISFGQTALEEGDPYLDYQPLSREFNNLEEEKERLFKKASDDFKKYYSRLKTSKARESLEARFKGRANAVWYSMDRNRFISDSLFVTYVQNITNQIVRSNKLQDVFERVLIDHYWSVNAKALGEGTIIIDLGLLRRVRSESELAFVIAHELAHLKLDHGNETLVKRTKIFHSREYKNELKRIQKKDDLVIREALEYQVSIIYKEILHGRTDEFEADSLGFIFMKNADYLTTEAVTCLNLLDSANELKYKTFRYPKEIFDSEKYPYLTYWDEAVTEDKYDKETSLFELDPDSLITHPNIDLRIVAVERYAYDGTGFASFQDNSVLKEIRKRSDFEIIETAFFYRDFGRSMFLSDQLLLQYENNPYLINMVISSLIKLFEFRIENEGERFLPKYVKEAPEGLRQTYLFLENLKLDELGEIAYHYINNKSHFNSEYEGHYYNLWKISKYLGQNGVEKGVRKKYLEKFPNGKYYEEFQLNKIERDESLKYSKM